MTTIEQRRSPRRAISWRARLLRGNGSIVECRAIDSSEGGVGLISGVPLVLGELLRVALLVPGEGAGAAPTVQVHQGMVLSSVLTHDGYRVGLRLVDPLAELLAEIPEGF